MFVSESLLHLGALYQIRVAQHNVHVQHLETSDLFQTSYTKVTRRAKVSWTVRIGGDTLLFAGYHV